ncbi:hypothetical protein DEO72_LG8g3016 [Vigna unguiculata]|uniref:DUF506 family protein n=1 Tax=Vigna unguiculata TaxID=3917 RepID=A0A4D6MTJ2_VIGUN|nr:hypothetical protein DEO72_LG7g208 [Vigna unguiculata]QCE04408.1 hypothetical protein DEO72_LG8g2444 [Vigna unguiculata]QCE04974.1 hypothetical protein DEO72_LG8g3016 [Vigna unguiculata]
MVVSARKKRVTDPFDEEAKARLVGGDHRQLSYTSSGSEHSGDEESPCLSELVHDFLEDNDDSDNNSERNDFDSERVDSVSDCVDSVDELLMLMESNTSDSYKNLLLSHTSEAAEKFAFLKERNISTYLRNAMSFLRENGHNAAICKTRWDSSGGATAGNYEFIDVVPSGPSTWHKRYFVDLDFVGQFEIARPTKEYLEFLSYVPRIFVGTAEELKSTVRILCGVAKRCFRKRGLTVPPWRKYRYMHNKWFGSYRRTTNPVQGNPVLTAVSALGGAKCRFVGFDDSVSGRRGGVVVRTR